ncbi:phosphoribosylaminoimidazolesuccinocarboxamide synthase [Eremococcus coleocola]|uniref:phosphoribosylaminoimidazolesuccinocarboxamide synthase n=1 Tax=Eremococcus coleocola TaxID=88132 RepID=UPI00040C712E|nr:phosphoribosylaminoimidazolesuccinocarboxamide synthase [Eremococcus coleocola]
MVNLARQIGQVFKDDLAKKDLDLNDIKIEFGMVDGRVALIDKISGENMLAYQDGEYVLPLDLEKILLG